MFITSLRFSLAIIALTLLTSPSWADVVGFSDDNNGNGFTIPDNGSIQSTIDIQQSLSIVDASFSVEGLDHSWIGDLIISVAHSTSGKSATLMHRVGTTSNPNSTGDSSDVNGTYTFRDGNPSIWSAAADGGTDFVVPAGTYDASGVNESLVSLNQIFGGETTAGTWTFTLEDANGGIEGQFLRTSVNFVAVPEPATGTTLLILSLPLMLRRRKG